MKSPRHMVCMVVMLATAPTFCGLAADRSGELTDEQRDALAPSPVEGVLLEVAPVPVQTARLDAFYVADLKTVSIDQLVAILVDLATSGEIDQAAAVITSLPVETATDILVSLAQTHPSEFASLLAAAPLQTVTAILRAITEPERLQALSPATIQGLANAFAAMATVQVQSNFNDDAFLAYLSIKQISPGFHELNPESHFGVRLRQLRRQAVWEGMSDALQNQIAAVYREALEAMVRLQPQEAGRDGQ